MISELKFFILSWVLAWTPTLITSASVGCQVPQTPYNGNFEVSGCSGILVDPFDPPCWKDVNSRFPVGRVVTYFCHNGYALKGEKAIRCLESGRWNLPFPKCCLRRDHIRRNYSSQGIDGSTLDVFEKAAMKSGPLIAGSDEGISCQPLEQTKSVEFECRLPNGAITGCTSPPLPPYTVAHLKCAQYYKSTTDLAYRYRKCKPDGTWSTEGSITCINDCGRSDSAKKPLITNGQTSDRGQWPWHAAMYITGRESKSKVYACGGTLISPHVVLTAAHCVTRPGTSELRETSTVTFALGKHSRDFGVKESTPIQIRQPKTIYIPDGYSPVTFDADIALVVLSNPVQFNFYVRPVCIPESYNSLIEEYQIQEGNLGTVVGFGLTETGILSSTLRMAQLPVVSSRTCIDSFQSFFQQNRRYTNFCAGYKNGTGVCNGDSGGGMVFPSGNQADLRWYLQGVVSVGVPDPDDSNKCNSHQYSLFTRVGRFSDWILRTLTPNGYL